MQLTFTIPDNVTQRVADAFGSLPGDDNETKRQKVRVGIRDYMRDRVYRMEYDVAQREAVATVTRPDIPDAP